MAMNVQERVSSYSNSFREDLIPSSKDQSSTYDKKLKSLCITIESWKLFFAASILCFIISYRLTPPSMDIWKVPLSSSMESVSDPMEIQQPSRSSMLEWHIKPIKPYHHGKVQYEVGTDGDGDPEYKRISTVPCGDGVLVFNVGPAASYEPFAYDMYDDAYAYSNNQGLCVLYPSYQGIQTSSEIMWNDGDAMELVVDLGDLPTKISSRIVKKDNTKCEEKRGGDFLIMRSGNFYNPTYYQHLKAAINSWPPDIDDMEIQIHMTIQELDVKLSLE